MRVGYKLRHVLFCAFLAERHPAGLPVNAVLLSSSRLAEDLKNG